MMLSVVIKDIEETRAAGQPQFPTLIVCPTSGKQAGLGRPTFNRAQSPSSESVYSQANSVCLHSSVLENWDNEIVDRFSPAFRPKTFR